MGTGRGGAGVASPVEQAMAALLAAADSADIAEITSFAGSTDSAPTATSGKIINSADSTEIANSATTADIAVGPERAAARQSDPSSGSSSPACRCGGDGSYRPARSVGGSRLVRWAAVEAEMAAAGTVMDIVGVPEYLREAKARRIFVLGPGPDLAEELWDLDHGDLGEQALIEAVAGFERLASWAVAAQARVVGELLARQGNRSQALGEVATEIGARLGMTSRAAQVKVELADALGALPVVSDALAAGRVDVPKARVLVDRDPGMPAHDHHKVVTDLIEEAEELTTGQLRSRLRTAALKVDPDAAAARAERERERRKVTFTPAPDAMAWINAYVPAETAATVRCALDALADAAKSPTDARDIDQRRADAFGDVFAKILDAGVDLSGNPLPTRGGEPVRVQVTVGAGTLLGADDEPAVLGGYGPIPAELARTLAQDATWRGLFTDAEGAFVALGTPVYRPGRVITRTIVARDVTCTFPGCRQPATRCDIDHIAPYNRAERRAVDRHGHGATRTTGATTATGAPASSRGTDGTTTTCNLQALCRFHHQLKTSKAWHVTRDQDGTTTWTAPTGHTYTRHPEPVPGAPPRAKSPPRWPDDDKPPPF